MTKRRQGGRRLHQEKGIGHKRVREDSPPDPASCSFAYIEDGTYAYCCYDAYKLVARVRY